MTDSEDLAKGIQEATNECDFDDLPTVTDWCSTGIDILDLAIANQLPGGVPVGRVIQAYGGASTAKSVLACTIMGYAMRSDKHAYLGDIEYTFDPKFAAMYGLDVHHPNFHYGYSFEDPKKLSEQPGSIEEFFDHWIAGILKSRIRKPKVAVVDTITPLPAAIELEKGMDKSGFGAYRAKQISLGFRKYLREMSEKGLTLFAIDQTRDDITSCCGGETTTGGRGLEFYSSVRLYLKHDKKVVNSSDKEIGIWVKFDVAKNKVAPPFRKGKFKILFEYGMDNITTNLSWLAEVQGKAKEDTYKLVTQVVVPSCSKCGHLQTEVGVCAKCGGEVKDVSKRLMDWVPLIEEKGLEKDLSQVVAGNWPKVYATEPRKPRVW